MAFDAALGASDESNFMSDQEFIPDCGISTLMAAFPAWLGIVSKFIDSVAGSVGFNVEVIPVGNTTYGEPFGFYAQDNCGTACFSIQLRAENDRRFGDYSDDFSRALGDPFENRLAAALNCTANDCPVGRLPGWKIARLEYSQHRADRSDPNDAAQAHAAARDVLQIPGINRQK